MARDTVLQQSDLDQLKSVIHDLFYGLSSQWSTRSASASLTESLPCSENGEGLLRDQLPATLAQDPENSATLTISTEVIITAAPSVEIIPEVTPSIITEDTPAPTTPLTPRVFEAKVCKSELTDCVAFTVKPRECVQLTSDLSQASAGFAINFMADCYLYKKDNCNPSTSQEVQYPGASGSEISKYGYKGKIKSFKCYPVGFVEDSVGLVGVELGRGPKAASDFYFPPA